MRRTNAASAPACLFALCCVLSGCETFRSVTRDCKEAPSPRPSSPAIEGHGIKTVDYRPTSSPDSLPGGGNQFATSRLAQYEAELARQTDQVNCRGQVDVAQVQEGEKIVALTTRKPCARPAGICRQLVGRSGRERFAS
jgi:hypothetical protein